MKTVIVTGGNAGLGHQCARSIAADPGYHVVLACRSLPRGEAAAAALHRPNVSVMRLDLASLSSVRDFAGEFSRTDLPPLEAVVANAGVSAGGVPGVTRTVDGVEPIFGVNHLGHFLLTNLLLPRMSPAGRIVFVTSDLHNPPPLFPVRVSYPGAAAIAAGRSGMRQYCLSKLCNLYCVYEMDRLLRERTDNRITVNAFNPGAMADTGFSSPSGNAFTRAAVRAVGGVMGALIGKQSTAAESGALLASLVTGPSFAGVSGRYFDRSEEAKSSPLSYDRDNARELWHAGMSLSGLTASETVLR